MKIDPYLHCHGLNLQKRTVDTLIGISKGIVADDIVNQAEAEALLSWMGEHFDFIRNDPLLSRLLLRVDEMLLDEHLDADEAKELHDLLVGLSDGLDNTGRSSRPTTLPLDDPAPRVVFPDRRFAFTGVFNMGKRTVCENAVFERGGLPQQSITRSLDYLVIGTYATLTWSHESYGNKIAKAVKYRDARGAGLAIISEDHWTAAMLATGPFN